MRIFLGYFLSLKRLNDKVMILVTLVIHEDRFNTTFDMSKPNAMHGINREILQHRINHARHP